MQQMNATGAMRLQIRMDVRLSRRTPTCPRPVLGRPQGMPIFPDCARAIIGRVHPTLKPLGEFRIVAMAANGRLDQIRDDFTRHACPTFRNMPAREFSHIEDMRIHGPGSVVPSRDVPALGRVFGLPRGKAGAQIFSTLNCKQNPLPRRRKRSTVPCKSCTELKLARGLWLN